jgi:hypothetical protein
LIPNIEKFLPVAIFKMAATIPHTNSTLSDFNDISYVGRLWCPELILTSKNFYRSPFSKWLPQCRSNSTLFDFSEISYVGRLWWPELIPDIEKFLPVSIFKMATTILQKFSIVRFQRYFLIYFLNLLSVAGLGDLRLHNC